MKATNISASGHHIYVDTVIDKEFFLNFWKPYYSTKDSSDANVSILSRTEIDLSEDLNNALVIVSSNDDPKLYNIDNGIRFFGSVFVVNKLPSNLVVVNTIYDDQECAVSYILKDDQKKVIYIPFSLDQVFKNYYLENYIVGRKTFVPKSILRAYYIAKRLVPPKLIFQLRSYLTKLQEKQDFPKWPLELSFEDLKIHILRLLLTVSKRQELPFVWFWPEGYESCLLLTHDVETCLTGNAGIERIISLERSHGFKSSFNVVPFKYDIDNNVLNGIKSAGCEVGVHDYSHDAKLFASRDIFLSRVDEINKVAKEWDAVGFRSAAMYRNAEWLKYLDFDYDMSFFDTDCYEPQPGGCMSFFPYFIGNMVELPMTVPQDHTLISLRKEKGIKIWLNKSNEIMKRNGMVCLNFHPDPGYIGCKDNIGLYDELLKYYSDKSSIWNTLPCELAQWWRSRNSSIIINEECDIDMDGAGLTAKWAMLEDNGQVTFRNKS